MQRSEIYRLIDGEREYQQAIKQPDSRPVGKWLNSIRYYLAKADDMQSVDSILVMSELRKAAAVIVAAMQQYGCPPRDGYEPPAAQPEQPVAPGPAFYVWWLSQDACEQIVDRVGDELSESVPEYIRSEYLSRLGRPGRGRLWVHDSLEVHDIPWDAAKPAARLAESCGGIVIRAEDAPHVFSLPGFLTDLELNFINSIKQRRPGDAA